MEHTKKYWLFYLIVLAIIIVFGSYTIKFYDTTWTNNISLWGSFGDYLGGTFGVIINLLAVILIYLTFRDQQNFIKSQRKNNILNVISTSIDQKEKKLEKIEYKKFSDIKNSTSRSNPKFLGSDALNNMLKDLHLFLVEKKGEYDNKSDLRDDSYMYTIFYSLQLVIPFLKTVKNAFSIIKMSGLNTETQKFLVDFYSASLSNNEIFLIYLVSKHHYDTFGEKDTYGFNGLYNICDEFNLFDEIEKDYYENILNRA